MKTIEVCLTPELMSLYPVQGYAVVVADILRATSCMTTAFAHGVKSIKPFAKLDDCLAMKAHGFFTAGERDGKKVEGFDFGNSPFEYMQSILHGQQIAFTTTNGTQAIVKSEGADQIIVGSFLNISAVANYLRTLDQNVLIVCAGWKGKFSLEDTVFAGALVERLEGNFEIGDDSALSARDIYSKAKTNLLAYLNNSSHVKRLARLNITKDIEFCLTPDLYNVLPAIKDGVLQLVQ